MALIAENDSTLDDDEKLVQESVVCAGYRDLPEGDAEQRQAPEAQPVTTPTGDPRTDATEACSHASPSSSMAAASTAATSASTSAASAAAACVNDAAPANSAATTSDDAVAPADSAATADDAALADSVATASANDAATADSAAAASADNAAPSRSASKPEVQETGSASSSTSQEGPPHRIPKVSQECIEFIIDASAKEERAMVFDRAGAYPGAVNLYRESAAVMSQALRLCPENHPDYSKIEVHIQEVLARAAYLYSLGVEPAEIPLEDHIHGAALSFGPCSKDKQTTLAAGAVGAAAGLVLAGPLGMVGLAAGAAYATSRKDGVGKVARGVGEVGVEVVDKAKKFNQKHGLDEKVDKKLQETARAVDERLQIIDKAQRVKEVVQAADEKYGVSKHAQIVSKNAQVAGQKADKFFNRVDEQFGISRKSEEAAAKTAQAIREFNEKHQVTEKINERVANTSEKINESVASASEKINESVANARSAVTGWVASNPMSGLLSRLSSSERTSDRQVSSSSQFSRESLG